MVGLGIISYIHACMHVCMFVYVIDGGDGGTKARLPLGDVLGLAWIRSLSRYVVARVVVVVVVVVGEDACMHVVRVV